MFYCPFAFRIDAKTQYVVANFVQNVMCALRQKTQRHSEIEGLKYCAIDVFTFFALFLFSQTDSDCICRFLPTDCLHLRNVSYFAKAYRKLHCLQTVATLHIFRQHYCCLGKTNENLICNLHKIYFGKLQKPSQFLPLLRFLRKKRQA